MEVLKKHALSLTEGSAVPVPALGQTGQRRSLSSPEWLRVYALKRFAASQAKQSPFF
jgi:hypothetical protein